MQEDIVIKELLEFINFQEYWYSLLIVTTVFALLIWYGKNNDPNED